LQDVDGGYKLIIDINKQDMTTAFSPDDILTSRSVCGKIGITPQTLYSWRRGYYFSRKNKVFYFKDQSHLPCIWNVPLSRWEYNPVKLMVWITKLNRKSYRIIKQS